MVRAGIGDGAGNRVRDGARLAALRDTTLLDAAPDASLERLNRLAVELLGVPVSLVSLVDEDRQVFAGQVGLPEPWASFGQTPLSHSFCQHVVQRDAPLVIADARTDPLVSTNLAIRDIGVIAYAGVPLRLRSGETLGSFCAIDGKRRDWSERDLRILEDLAMLAADAIELHRVLDGDPLRDALTGLPSRSLFRELVNGALERGRRADAASAVLALDLVDFRLINDALGHRAGDEILIAVAQRIAAELRRGDAICRLGADEFLILCEVVEDEADALRIAERMRDVVARVPYLIDGQTQSVAATIGIALLTPADGSVEAELLLQEASASLARVKAGAERLGASTTASTRASAGRRLRLRNAVADAHRRGEMRLAYQPLVDLRTGDLLGFEALARWTHPELGPVAPDEFIPAAEMSGAIVSLGEWILEQACSDMAAWRRLHPAAELSIAVNVAPVQLHTANFADVVAATLARTGLPASSLRLEVTERTLLDDRAAHLRALSVLRGLGVRIALDDFGTGYSALGYLIQFPIDVVKIDRAFVTALDQQPQAAALIEGIVTIARGLELRTVAEGIETETQRRLLEELGCDIGQGYLLGRPMAAGDVPALL